MTSQARWLLTGVVACGLAFMLGAPAVASAPFGSAASSLDSAAGPTPSVTNAEPDVMRWTGEVVFTETEPGTGITNESAHWSDVIVEYVCLDAKCNLVVTGGVSSDSTFSAEEVLLDLRDFTDVALDGSGSFSRSFTPVGDPCNPDEPVLPNSLAEGTLNTTTAVMTMATEEWGADCAGGGRNTYYSSVRSFEGVYMSGDPCALTGVCGLEVVALVTPPPSVAPVEAGEQVPQAEPVVASQKSASQLASGAAAAPSVLSALVPIQDSQVGFLDVCVAVVVTLILSLLVALPKKLFSSAVSAVPKRWSEYRKWLSTRKGALAKRWNRALATFDKRSESTADNAEESGTPNHAVLSGPWRKAALGVVLAGIISCFVDPEFGFNLGSLRVAVSLSASFVLTVVIGWGVAIWIARRFTPGLAASYSFKPLSLVIVALTVVFTRATGMEPGMVFGLVAGVALGAMSSKATEARVAVAQTGYAFAVGIVGWLTYSALAPSLAGSHNLFAALLIDTLSGLSVAGFAAAPLALLPVAGMGGSAVFDWNPRVWFLVYSVGLVGFFVVLMPMSYSWREVDFSLKAWVGLYLAYAAAAMIAYLALVRPWESARARLQGSESEDIDSEGVEADVG